MSSIVVVVVSSSHRQVEVLCGFGKTAALFVGLGGR